MAGLSTSGSASPRPFPPPARRRIPLIGLLFIVGLLLSGNVALLYESWRHQRALTALRLDPLAMGGASSAQDFTKADLMILGDSHAAGWGLTGLGTHVANLGVSGHTSAQVLYRCELLLSETQANCILVFAGGNDAKAAGFQPERIHAIAQDCISNLKEARDFLAPRCRRLVFCTIPPLFRQPASWYLMNREACFEARQIINEGLREFQGDHVEVLDAWEIFSARGDLPSLSSDGVHMNAAGYALLEARLRELLRVAPR